MPGTRKIRIPGIKFVCNFLQGVGRTEDVADLVGDEALDSRTSRGQVLTRVEVIRMFVEVLTDGSRHGKTQVGVDVDLADRALGSLTEHVFRNTDSVGHLAAVGVDLVDEFRDNAGSAVENDREVRQEFFDLFEDVEAETRGLARLELVSAVAGADGDGQRVNAGLFDEFLNFGRIGELSIGIGYVYIVFYAGKLSEFAFDRGAVSVGIFNDFSCEFYILRKGVL